ncbi:hypothetical protein [Caballeronia insecticola]|uniref:hypothetical protein n=1 Tax=Caballeronia insecticola TaxID=758793 RepID=UPI0005C4E17A|nr:hypothetical protein [Caballeronia insecticola]
MNLWDSPPYTAHAAPVLWTPSASTGECFVAIVLIQYESPEHGKALARLALGPKQLRAMIGAKRAQSALGIMGHVAEFMHQQLAGGTAFADVIAPFDEFHVGKATRIRGYSERQVVDTATRTLSAFAARGSFDDEADQQQRNSIPTRQFLRSLRSAFARDDEARKARFNKTIDLYKSAQMTIDYAYEQCLVQVTSLPQTVPHLVVLQKEAESKILELDITAGLLQSHSAPSSPSLLVNIAPLNTAETSEARRIAGELFDRLTFMSEQKKIALVPVKDPFEAAQLLEQFEMNRDYLQA